MFFCAVSMRHGALPFWHGYDRIPYRLKKPCILLIPDRYSHSDKTMAQEPESSIMKHKALQINIDSPEWQALSHEEKNRILFEHQKKTLDLFLERGAISREQYNKSLRDLTEKMGIAEDHTP